MNPGDADGRPVLRARRLHLFSQDEAVVLLRADCPVCRSEGLAPRARVLLEAAGREVVAVLYQVAGDLVAADEAGLSEAAWRRLEVEDGAALRVRHPPSLASIAGVRRRAFGERLERSGFDAVIRDVVAGRYAGEHMAAFIATSAAFPLDLAETTALTGAMADAGERLRWARPVVADKHSVGGLPGNRTTPIVVAIASALGLTMPKTSSRAITSASGTADAMETLAPVDLDLATMRRVVDAEGGCVVWGGAVRLSPADDVLIRVERLLDMDPQGQLVASVLSKKVAAGATHLVLDVPVGPTAKVRTPEAAEAVVAHLTSVAAAFGITTRCLLTPGVQPVGRGLGPALEARDVLAVLQNAVHAPADLRARAVLIAGALLELVGAAPAGSGAATAAEVLDSGRAWTKFLRICEAQGGLRAPPAAPLRRDILADRSGVLVHLDNRRIAKLAKLAGAPDAAAAGLELHVRLGDDVMAGRPLATLHAEAPGELAYALDYAVENTAMFGVEA